VMYRFRHYIVAAIVGVLAFAVRAFNFRHGELPGFHEIVATLDALLPFGQYLRTEEIYLCPPVYYLILKPVAAVGTSLWLVRLPSLLVGSATPVFLYLFMEKHAGALSAFLGAVLLALAPVHVFYSQQADPLVFASAASLVAFVVFLEMRHDHQFKFWIAYDLTLLALLHLHREAAFVAFAFLVLHLTWAWWFRRTAPRLRRRRIPPVAVIFLHHFWVLLLALPWLAIMPTKASWDEPRPTWWDFFSVPVATVFLGKALPLTWLWWGIFGVFYAALFPTLLRLLQRRGGIVKSSLVAVALSWTIPFLWSLSGRCRFFPFTTPALVMPVAFALFGTLLAHSRPLIRVAGFLTAVAAMIMGIMAEARTPSNPPYAKVAKAIEDTATTGSVVVTLPDYAGRMSSYFLGDRYQVVTAEQFFEKWAEVPKEQIIYFASYQFPTREAHPYTLWGALSEFAESKLLFREGTNLAIAARNLNVASLRLWYDDPESLNIVDQPTSAALFIFHPYDNAFRGPEFLRDSPSFNYEFTGRRCVWLVRDSATIPLKVSLEPGHYILRLHASPDFVCPDTGQVYDRSVEVVMRVGEEQVQKILNDEDFIELPIDVEQEINSLTVILRASRLDRVSCPRPVSLALKIYSIAIEAAEPRLQENF